MNADEKDYCLEKIDSGWTAVHQATLLFIVDGDNILLIRKKRGLGAGKINGPGGKLDPGETLVACAVREVQEELSITPVSPRPFGELRFQFTDGYSIHVHVFVATEYTGQPVESDEAIPLWFACAEIPYDEMWADDEIWLPRVLAGEVVSGRFVFSGDRLLDHEVKFSSSFSVEA